MDDPIERLRADRSAMLDALVRCGADVRKPQAFRCPFHDDKTPSAGVYQGDDGAWRFKCQAGTCGFHGDVFDVRAKGNNRTAEDEMRDEREREKIARPKFAKSAPAYPSVEAWAKAHDHVTDVYRYTDPDTGKIDLLKLRAEPPDGKKTFTQAHVNAKGHVVASAPPSPWPIYNRKRIKDADRVIVVEGEKCVHALHKAGVVATCGSAGAGKGKAALTDWGSLKGRTVYLWPDHDPPDKDGERAGHRFMREVADQLQPLDCRVLWIDPDKLSMGDKEDAADYVARFDAESLPDAIGEIFDAAEPMGGASVLLRHYEDAITGKRWTIPWPWRVLSNLGRAIQPGMVSVVCGEPGSKKSWAMLQATHFWIEQGVDVRVHMLENDKAFHMNRYHVQIAKCEHLNSTDWQRQNPDTVRRLTAEFGPSLDTISRKLTDCPSAMLDYPHVLAWVKASCESGAQILVVDPITQVDGGREPWRSDKQFLVEARAVLRKHQAHLILVTHPRDGKHNYGMDGIAGSRGFSRFPESIFWLRRHDKGSAAVVRTPLGESRDQVDASIKILKARNGHKASEGAEIALRLDESSVTFVELGLVIGKVEAA